MYVATAPQHHGKCVRRCIHNVVTAASAVGPAPAVAAAALLLPLLRLLQLLCAAPQQQQKQQQRRTHHEASTTTSTTTMLIKNHVGPRAFSRSLSLPVPTEHLIIGSAMLQEPSPFAAASVAGAARLHEGGTWRLAPIRLSPRPSSAPTPPQ